jgi:hypothetical protein
MKVKSSRLYLGAMMVPTFLLAFAGIAPAADVHQGVTGQREVYQSGDQDPKTPPDCAKYPRDTRCKKG